MSLSNGGKEEREKIAKTISTLFFTTSREELEQGHKKTRLHTEIMGDEEGDNPHASEGRFTRGSDDELRGIEPGKRPPSWYERIESRTKDNAKRGIENSKLLGVLDYRTVWITRLLTGILISLLAAGVINYLGI